MRSIITVPVITVPVIAATTALIIASSAVPAGARDDGRYAGSPLKAWFDRLASTKGLCCSFADGVTIEDVDWDTGGAKGGYRVRLGGVWIDVPEAALVKEPNKFGPAVVWPYRDVDGVTQIRCFLPGAGT
ncbi:MAG TPA: hypothetical protein VMA30_16765 [Xanthobacteraceae bacterium]|nr:hypothetical protein [Xanthobacteraceae bacterium]